jgi:hypothetical protein
VPTQEHKPERSGVASAALAGGRDEARGLCAAYRGGREDRRGGSEGELTVRSAQRVGCRRAGRGGHCLPPGGVSHRQQMGSAPAGVVSANVCACEAILPGLSESRFIFHSFDPLPPSSTPLIAADTRPLRPLHYVHLRRPGRVPGSCNAMLIEDYYPVRLSPPSSTPLSFVSKDVGTRWRCGRGCSPNHRPRNWIHGRLRE